MTIDAVRTSAVDQLPSFLIYDTIDASAAAAAAAFLSDNAGGGALPAAAAAAAAGGRRKRRRRARSCKNKEEAESQRMTHIAVERNRRRQMNEYLAVLRSLMPDSYVHRGDQASIVGGAIDFVKELEQLLQSLEAQKRTLLSTQHQRAKCDTMPTPGSATRIDSTNNCSSSGGGGVMEEEAAAAYDARPPFAEFFSYPQYAWCHSPRDCAPLTVAENRSAVADVEVALVETHANVRVMSARRPGQLLRLVAGLQSLGLAVLHLNVTTLEPLVLYSLSVKVEEGCSLSTVDDIAGAVHDVLSIIDAEVASQQPQVVLLSRGQ